MTTRRSALARRLLAAYDDIVVLEAEGVADALVTAARVKPSAALVDVGLPDGDGFALARELAGLPWRPRVLVTSVTRAAGHAEEARRSGAQAFLNKAELPDAPLGRLLGIE